MLHQAIIEQLQTPLLKSTKKSAIFKKLQQQKAILISFYNQNTLSIKDLIFLGQILDQFNGNNSNVPLLTLTPAERKLTKMLVDKVQEIVDKHDLVIVDEDKENDKYYLTTQFCYRKSLPQTDVVEVSKKNKGFRKNSIFSSNEKITQPVNTQESNIKRHNMSVMDLRVCLGF